MKAKIFSNRDGANSWIAHSNIDVQRIEISTVEVLSTRIKWTEERIIVYYIDKNEQVKLEA